MRRAALAMLSVALTIAACTGPPTKQIMEPLPELDKVSDPTVPLRFSRFRFDLRPGAAVGRYRYSLSECSPRQEYIHWREDGLRRVGRDWGDRAHRVLRHAGFEVTTDPDHLYPEARSIRRSAFYLLGAKVVDINLDVCDHIHWWTLDHTEQESGSAEITVEWQLYSVLDEYVLFRTETTGTSTLENRERFGTALMVDRAFTAAVAELASDSQFRDFMSTLNRRPLDRARSHEATLRIDTPPPFDSPLEGRGADIRHSVVTIGPGRAEGHGSGFFLSATFIMTNAHVVGGDERIPIRLATGRRIMGEVVRVHDQRDVALIRVEDQGHTPLPIRETPVKVAETVYSVGAPLRRSLRASLRRGTVSRYRPNKFGMEDIQADAPVHGGNSGGPLLDAKGNVVGVTYAGFDFGTDMDFGLNLFVPISDALDKLNIELRRRPNVWHLD